MSNVLILQSYSLYNTYSYYYFHSDEDLLLGDENKLPVHLSTPPEKHSLPSNNSSTVQGKVSPCVQVPKRKQEDSKISSRKIIKLSSTGSEYNFANTFLCWVLYWPRVLLSSYICYLFRVSTCWLFETKLNYKTTKDTCIVSEGIKIQNW